MSRTGKLCLESSTFCSDVADSSDLPQPESFSGPEVELKLKLSSGSLVPHFTTGGVKGALASLAAEGAVDGEGFSPKTDRRFRGRVDSSSDDVRDLKEELARLYNAIFR